MDMIIKIDAIKSNAEHKLEVDFSEIIAELNKTEPVEANLVFSMYANEINVKGIVIADVELKCDLCLNSFVEHFEIDMNENYVLGRLFEDKKGEFELSSSDFVQELIDTDELDVTDLVYQTVTLNLPNKFVCDINCKGVEEMGKYISQNTPDPRLDVFKKIKIEKDN